MALPAMQVQACPRTGGANMGFFADIPWRAQEPAPAGGRPAVRFAP